MVKEQLIKDKWNEIQEEICNHWKQLTQDDMKKCDGDTQRLIGVIQRKTGETREKIEKYLDELTNNSLPTMQEAADSVRDYAHHVSENVSDYASKVADSLKEGTAAMADSARDGYQQTEELVRSKPVESLAVCFGVGMLTGVIVGLTLRSR